MRLALTAGILFGFPALAVSSRRNHGTRRLVAMMLLALGVIAAFALMASSSRFGNALAESRGYWSIARGSLLIFGMHLGVPVLAGTAAAAALAPEKLPYWAVYAATVGGASLGWVAGMLGSLVLLSR